MKRFTITFILLIILLLASVASPEDYYTIQIASSHNLHKAEELKSNLLSLVYHPEAFIKKICIDGNPPFVENRGEISLIMPMQGRRFSEWKTSDINVSFPHLLEIIDNPETGGSDCEDGA